MEILANLACKHCHTATASYIHHHWSRLTVCSTNLGGSDDSGGQDGLGEMGVHLHAQQQWTEQRAAVALMAAAASEPSPPCSAPYYTLL